MRKTDKEDARNADRGIGAGTAQLNDDQRDTEKDVGHMPRHWQAHGSRGEAPGQAVPGPDEREPARGNQHDRAGELASRQVREALTEHGRTPAPQHRDNQQLPKRPGEGADELPTPPDKD